MSDYYLLSDPVDPNKGDTFFAYLKVDSGSWMIGNAMPSRDPWENMSASFDPEGFLSIRGRVQDYKKRGLVWIVDLVKRAYKGENITAEDFFDAFARLHGGRRPKPSSYEELETIFMPDLPPPPN